MVYPFAYLAYSVSGLQSSPEVSGYSTVTTCNNYMVSLISCSNKQQNIIIIIIYYPLII